MYRYLEFAVLECNFDLIGFGTMDDLISWCISHNAALHLRNSFILQAPEVQKPSRKTGDMLTRMIDLQLTLHKRS